MTRPSSKSLLALLFSALPLLAFGCGYQTEGQLCDVRNAVSGVSQDCDPTLTCKKFSGTRGICCPTDQSKAQNYACQQSNFNPTLGGGVGGGAAASSGGGNGGNGGNGGSGGAGDASSSVSSSSVSSSSTSVSSTSASSTSASSTSSTSTSTSASGGQP